VRAPRECAAKVMELLSKKVRTKAWGWEDSGYPASSALSMSFKSATLFTLTQNRWSFVMHTLVSTVGSVAIHSNTHKCESVVS
jgi:hypothetical protein